MKRRIFLRKEGTGARTRYFYRYEGENKVWKTDPTNWKMYKLRESLLDNGVDEEELNELLELKYQEGYTEAEVECRR